MKQSRSKFSELLKLLKETGKSYWELIGNPLPAFDSGKKGVTSSNGQYYVRPENYNSVLNSNFLEVTLPEVEVVANRLKSDMDKSIDRAIDKKRRKDFIRNYVLTDILRDLEPPKPIRIKTQLEDDWQPIEMYDKGKPSNRLRRQIAEWEGSDFSEQQAKFGDAVGKFYDWTRQLIGDKIWDKLTPNQRDALTSYRYNIKYGSFLPTVQALREWYNTPTPENLNAVRNTINVGMNREGMSGLRKRRLAEQDWFMEGTEPLPPKESTIDVLKPIIIVNTLKKPKKAEKTPVILQPEQTVVPVQDVQVPYRGKYISDAIENFRRSIVGYDEGKDDIEGVTSSNGQYHVAPENYDSVLNADTLNVDLPETVVTAKAPLKFGTINPDVYGENYRTANHPEDLADVTNVMMGPMSLIMANPFALSQYVSTGDYNKALDEALKYGMSMDGVLGHLSQLGGGLYGILNDNGVKKTANLFKSGQYGAAAMSFGGDVLNAALASHGGAWLGRDLNRFKFSNYVPFFEKMNHKLQVPDDKRLAFTYSQSKSPLFNDIDVESKLRQMRSENHFRLNILVERMTLNDPRAFDWQSPSKAERDAFSRNYDRMVKSDDVLGYAPREISLKYGNKAEALNRWYHISRNNPEYATFIREAEKNGEFLDPFDQSTVDRFIDLLSTSLRGVYADTDQIAKNALSLTIRGRVLTGGDALAKDGSAGGLYSSNSTGIAEAFKNVVGSRTTPGYVGKLKYDFKVDKTKPIEDQLSLMRNLIWNLDQPLTHSMYDVKSYPHGTKIAEREYARRDGTKLEVHERDILPSGNAGEPVSAVNVDRILKYDNTVDEHGRFGTKGVHYDPKDSELFLPIMLNRYSDFIKYGRYFLMQHKLPNSNYPSIRLDNYNMLRRQSNDLNNLYKQALKRYEWWSNALENAAASIGVGGIISGPASMLGKAIYETSNNPEPDDSESYNYGK